MIVLWGIVLNQSAQEDLKKLKKEIQSHDGLLSVIKKEKMPRKKEMASRYGNTKDNRTESSNKNKTSLYELSESTF